MILCFRKLATCAGGMASGGGSSSGKRRDHRVVNIQKNLRQKNEEEKGSD